MRINPVLKNETKLAARSIKFTLVLLFYIGLIAGGTLFVFYESTSYSYFDGLNLQSVVGLYVSIAVLQAALLMFIVPSLTSTAICSEREKQTLDILLSSKMSTFSIVSGKLMSSISRVILLIVCTMPMYCITLLIGGVNIKDILMICLFFIVTTIYVGSIGVCLSTFLKSSKVSTSVAYGLVLVLFIGLVVGAIVNINLRMTPGVTLKSISMPWFAYLSPTVGFGSLIIKQLGISTEYFIVDVAMLKGFSNAYIVSMIVQLALSTLLVLLSSYKLDPTNEKLLKALRK